MNQHFFSLLKVLVLIAQLCCMAYFFIDGFVFTYLNQSDKEPRLSFLGFGMPLILTLILLPISGAILLVNKRTKHRQLPLVLKWIFSGVVIYTLVWQLWLTVFLYNTYYNLPFAHRLEPVAFAIIAFLSTLYVFIKTTRSKSVKHLSFVNHNS